MVTANERRGSESELLGTEFAPPHRAARIHQLLRGRDDLAVEDFEAIHADAFAITALPLCALLRGLEAAGPGAEVRRTILEWDGVMAAGSRGAAAFAAWRSALTRRICAEPVLAPLLDDTVYGALLAPYLTLAGHVGLALEPLADAGTPYGIDVRRLAVEALEDAAGHPEAWGETHVFSPLHAFDTADADLVAPPVPVGAGVGRRGHGAVHGLAARRHRRGLPRLGGPLRVGPGGPVGERLGGADGRLGRPAVTAPPRPARCCGCCGRARGRSPRRGWAGGGRQG